jgi:hypothetical protein
MYHLHNSAHIARIHTHALALTHACMHKYTRVRQLLLPILVSTSPGRFGAVRTYIVFIYLLLILTYNMVTLCTCSCAMHAHVVALCVYCYLRDTNCEWSLIMTCAGMHGWGGVGGW